MNEVLRRRTTIWGLILASMLWPAAVSGPAHGQTADKAPTPESLIDHTGKQAGLSDFAGQFLLIYFGYTFCPDICPTGLQAMSQAIDLLGPDGGAKVAPLFVTIDPERDTVAVLADYVGNFHPRLVGLTGSPSLIKATADRFGIQYFKVFGTSLAGDDDDDGKNAGKNDDDDEDRNYLISHSSATFLFDRKGYLLTTFPHGATPEEMAAEMARRLAAAEG
ncbi:MAG: SCO family protein [Alphaproteobacteria bacterium]|nr:SCO family protein [Alphaproteobacteria bacterium]